MIMPRETWGAVKVEHSDTEDKEQDSVSDTLTNDEEQSELKELVVLNKKRFVKLNLKKNLRFV